MKWLYRYETKGIQSWILDSNLLRDLAGGSALVEQLTRVAAEEAGALGAEVLQSTSGSMTARFPDREALEKFASEWPMRVAYQAPGLQLVQAWSQETEGLSALFPKLAGRRNRMHVEGIEAGSWVLRAGRSGLPAIPTPSDIRSKARKTALDAAALAKERARGYEVDAAVTGGLPWSVFEERVEWWPEGPVAVIHADGSGVGQRLMGLDAQGLRKFSDALKAASKCATRAAIDELAREGNNKIHARPVVSAGDDLTYILPAPYARGFATTWLKAFEAETEKSKEALRGRLWGGAGIVLVHDRYPFSSAYEMAEKLCRAAKDEIKRRKREVSVLAFRRVTNSLVTDICSGVTGWVVNPESGLEELDKLLVAVRRLPRGTLRTWYDHFGREAGRAEQLWHRAAEVADAGAWAAFQKALESVGGDPATGQFADNGVLAFPLAAGRATPVGDALALRHIEKSRR